MILGLSIAIGVLAVGLVFWWLSLRFQPRQLELVAQWPEAPATRPDFAGGLAAIGVEVGPQPAPNYRSGEYPVVARHAATEHELVVAAEPVEVEPEPEPQYSGPWWAQPTVAVADERTPIFGESGSYPVLELDLSATNSWNRAALRERLGMDTEEAA